MTSVVAADNSAVLASLEVIEDGLEEQRLALYPPESKAEEAFRNYTETTPDHVRAFYKENHECQTLDFVLAQKAKYTTLDKLEMSVWEAIEKLCQIVDKSDPDTQMSQLEHALQTAEAMRKNPNNPRWMILTGLIHDLGKVLCLFGEPQWAVVGDTFPVGCAFSNKIVFPEFFAANPDAKNPALSTQLGIYEAGCGLDKVNMSWGHDEYLYWVCKDYLPEEALYMIRYHSFYAAHRERDYEYLMNDHDKAMFEWVRRFNPYDLYSKADNAPVFDDLKEYYQDLVNEFFPAKLKW